MIHEKPNDRFKKYSRGLGTQLLATATYLAGTGSRQKHCQALHCGVILITNLRAILNIFTFLMNRLIKEATIAGKRC